MEENNAKKVCGCCLTVENLIDVTYEPINLITLCFSIQITNYYSFDKSPIFVCNTCNKKLKDCYKFRRQILYSQNKLKILCSSESNSDFNSLCNHLLVYCNLDTQIFESESLIDKKILSNSNNTLKIEYLTAQKQKLNEKNDSDTALTTENSIGIKQKAKLYSNIKNSSFTNKCRIKKKEENRRIRAAKQREQYAKSLPYSLNKEDLTCKICDETFAAHKVLISHMAVHYPNYVCDICGKPFVLRRLLRIHAKSHEPKMVACTVCKKTLRTSSLSVHMKNHSDNKKHFACPHCVERFVSFDHRQRHMEKVHNVDIYKYHCKICSKKFHLSRHLSAHINRCHLRMLNASCGVCGKGFYSAGELKKHMIKHTGEKNYQCDICSKRFTKKWSLTLHLRAHNSKVEKHQCSQCGKEFTQKGSLNVHIKNLHET